MPDTDGAMLTVLYDGQEHFLPVIAGEALLDAADRAGVDLPSMCREGHCGACAAKLLEGAVEMPDCTALSKRDRAQGMILACQAVPASAMLKISYDE
jgi:3-ketosteroid 9alpha-monooxygenase subunit B